MELNEILDKMKEPEKLIEPNEMVILGQHIGGFITDYELKYDEAKMEYSFKWEKVKYETENGKPLSDKQTEIRMMRDDVYKKLNNIKRTLGELKRYRADLHRRVDIIMGIKRHS